MVTLLVQDNGESEVSGTLVSSLSGSSPRVKPPSVWLIISSGRDAQNCFILHSRTDF